MEVARGSAFVVNCLQRRGQLFCGFWTRSEKREKQGSRRCGRKRQARYAFAPELWKKLYATRRALGG